MTWLWWAPLTAVVAHIFEEFVWPGGFAEWDRRYRPQIRESITSRMHILVNAGLILLAANVGLAGNGGSVRIGGTGIASFIPPNWAAPAWIALAALLFSNALFHVIGTLRSGERSPGVITGVLLYIPLACFGYWYLLTHQAVSLPNAMLATAVGGSYHFWAALLHRVRAGSRTHS